MPSGPSKETMISPTKSEAKNYTRTLFEINVKLGTTSKLLEIGVRNKGNTHPYTFLPLVVKVGIKIMHFLNLKIIKLILA